MSAFLVQGVRPARPLRVLFDPGFAAHGIQNGDVIYVVTFERGVVSLVARARVRLRMSITDYRTMGGVVPEGAESEVALVEDTVERDVAIPPRVLSMLRLTDQIEPLAPEAAAALEGLLTATQN